MSDFVIVTDKELVDVELLMRNEQSLPEAMRQLNLCEAFVGTVGGRAVSVCLLAKRKGYYDIVNLAVDELREDGGADRELLLYVLDYVRAQGGHLVEIGAGNAELRRHELLTGLGFRVVGVWRDHYLIDARADARDDGAIPNRDMIRYRVDLNDAQRAV